MTDDDVRRKRLARLGGAGGPPTPVSNAVTAPDAAVDTAGVGSSAGGTAASSSSLVAEAQRSAPPKPLKAAVAPKPAPAPSSLSSQPSTKMDIDKKASPQEVQARFLRWQNDALLRIFQVTVDANDKTSGSTLLPGMASDFRNMMETETSSALVTKDMVDQLLMERAGLPSSEILFKYLIGCFKRLLKEDRDVRVAKTADLEQRLDVLQLTKQIIVSYTGLSLTEAEMFQQPQHVIDQGSLLLLPHILTLDMNSEDFLPAEFWAAFVQRFQNDGLETIFTPIIKAIVATIRTTNLLGNYQAPINAFISLLQHKPIAELVVRLPNWIPKDVTGRIFETASILGPFLKPSALIDDDPTVGMQFFQGDLSMLTRATLENATTTVRSSLNLLHQSQTELFNVLLRVSPATKEALLAFLGATINNNAGRSKMHVDEKLVSTDGFLINQTVALIRLCEPFMDPKGSKAALIDPLYIHRNHRTDCSKETRLAMQEKDANEWAKTIAPLQPNFISECFWLTAYYLHLGVNRAIVKYSENGTHMREIKRQISEIERAKPFPAHLAPQYDVLLARLKAQSDMMLRRQFCFEMQLLDENLLASLFRFYNLMASVLLKLARGSASSVDASAALNRGNAPEAFTALPEWVIEDLTDFCVFVCRNLPDKLHLAMFDDIFSLAALLLDQPLYIKNPYNRSKFIEILHYMTPDLREQMGGNAIPDMFPLLNQHPVLLKHLVPAMLSFYQEVERTGDSHQFYEKWPIRHNISLILKNVWSNPTHHANALAYADNLDNFVRFVNLLRNDTTYLLDESISKLKEIHKIQEQMKNREAWDAMPLNDRREVEKNLATAERMVTSYMHLANETVFMLRYLSKDIKAPFLRHEIIDHLVAMLNFNITKLVGPQTTELKVENKEKYMFRPKELLAGLVDIYLHLDSPELVSAIASDERSYRVDLFVKAADIMRKFNLKPAEEVDHLMELISRVEDARKNTKQEEEELGNVPDEFLDPITADIMRDPVMLPSGNIVDRSTIVTHLLSDSNDPFNRQPLKIEQVIPALDLKSQIAEFLQSKRRKASSADAMEL